MRVYISADIEGVAGVCGAQQTGTAGFEFTDARKWMTIEVIAAAEAAHEAGAGEVVVADGHGTAQNILPDELPDYVRLIRSWPRPLLQMQGIDNGHYDAALYIGHHTSMASEKGLASHTYHSGCLRDIRLNGVSQSETTLNTMLAAHYGVPVIFSAGDADYVAHVREMNPQVETVVTKEAIGFGSVNTLTPKVSGAAIREGVKRAFARRADIGVMPLPESFVLELEFLRRGQPELWAMLPWVRRSGTFSVEVEMKSMKDVMQMITFAIMYQAEGTPGF